MGLVTFKLYTVISLLLLVSYVLHAARINKGQYFGTVVHLTNTPTFAIIITNAGVWFTALMFKFATKLFFGELTLLERQKGVERFFLCLTESVLALAYLQISGYNFLQMFFCSILLRVLHSLGKYRHETIEHSAQPMIKQTVRLVLMMLTLFAFDLYCVYYFGNEVAQSHKNFDFSIIFLLDFSLMAVLAIGTLIRVYITQIGRLGGNHGESHHATKFYVNVVLSVLSSLLHIAFFGALLTYTIPLHLLRDLILNLSETATNCKHLMNYRRLTANIDRVLPDATKEQIDKDNKCAICYDDMLEGAHCKALPCSHVFHRECLLRWFEKQTACVYCGKDVKGLFDANVPVGPAPQPQQQPPPQQVPQQPVQPQGVAPPQQERPAAAAVINDNHADLDNLTDEELERELHRLVAQFQGASDRGVYPPAFQINHPAIDLSSQGAGRVTSPTASLGQHPYGQHSSASAPLPTSPQREIEYSLGLSSNPITLGLQLHAYRQYVTESRAALERLERELATISALAGQANTDNGGSSATAGPPQ